MQEKLNIDEIIMVDRMVDPITPILTQFTLGGCIDEYFSVDTLGKSNL